MEPITEFVDRQNLCPLRKTVWRTYV